MKDLKKTVSEIKSILIDFYSKKSYKIYHGFPLVSDDPTVMFINATITPFKRIFLNEWQKPFNVALIQKCLRMGGTNDLGLVGFNSFYCTFFEMFGSIFFGSNHYQAVNELMKILEKFGLNKENLYFTVPADDKYFIASIRNHGISESAIFSLEKNNVFWQEWRFGKFGLVGKGITIIYSRSKEKPSALDQIANNQEQFIEMLNLIYIYGKENEKNKIVSVANPGFELGMGIERLAAILQCCNIYQIDTIKSLVELVDIFFSNIGIKEVSLGKKQMIADHLRSICILINEGLCPSNKKQGYVLRKLIRRVLEEIWSETKNLDVSLEKLIIDFSNTLGKQNLIKERRSFIYETITREVESHRSIIKNAAIVLRKNHGLSREKLKDTYGISLSLVELLDSEKGGKIK